MMNNTLINTVRVTQVKIAIILISLCFVSVKGKAQDVIYKADSTTVQARVMEISDTEIKYTKFSNQSGPKYTISKSKVRMIIFENGEKEVYNATLVNQTNQVAVNPIKDSLQFLESLWGVKLENTAEKGGGIKIVKLEYNSIFKSGTSLKKLMVLNVRNSEKPVRVLNTSELTKVVFESYNQGISKVNLYAGKNRVSALSYYTTDEKGIDISGISKFKGENVPINKLGYEESKKAGYTVAGYYSPSKGWYMQGFCLGMLFGLPGIALVGVAALVPPNMPSIPPNVDADAWFKGYKSRINKKRFLTGVIGGALGSILVISAFSATAN